MQKSSELSASPMHGKKTHSKDTPEHQNDHDQQRIFRESTIILTELENKPIASIDGDNLFQTNYETNWTISDQHRLLAMDRLQARTLEYHNNVHQRTATNSSESSAEMDDIVAQILFCSSHGSERPFTTTKANFSSVLTQIKQKEQTKLKGATSWIHLFDLSELHSLDETFGMHPLCAASFRDLRCHSNIVMSSSGFVVSICYFQMNSCNFNVQMFKLYCYVSNGLIVTFIAELMPETEAAHMSGHDGETDDSDDLATNICSAVLDRWTKIIKRCSELGPLYLFYELATEALNQQDSLIEFFSRTLFYFKKKTNLSLSHRNKVAFMRKMHIVISAIQLIQFNIESISAIIDKLVLKAESSAANHTLSTDGNSTPHGSTSRGSSVMPLISDSLVGREQLPYLYDLQDLSDFLTACLLNEAHEAKILTDAMDSISQLKANNTAVSKLFIVYIGQSQSDEQCR